MRGKAVANSLIRTTNASAEQSTDGSTNEPHTPNESVAESTTQRNNDWVGAQSIHLPIDLSVNE